MMNWNIAQTNILMVGRGNFKVILSRLQMYLSESKDLLLSHFKSAAISVSSLAINTPITSILYFLSPAISKTISCEVVTPRLRNSGLRSTVLQNSADYEILSVQNPAHCSIAENNLHQQCVAELPHTNFSVKPGEKWRHYCRRSITQKQIVSVVSHRSNMHDANRLWDQIAFFFPSLFASPYHTHPPSTSHKNNGRKNKRNTVAQSVQALWLRAENVFSCFMKGVWCTLGSLNQAVVSLTGRLYINVIHQAAFTDMTSVAHEDWLDTTPTSNIFLPLGERD